MLDAQYSAGVFWLSYAHFRLRALNTIESYQESIGRCRKGVRPSLALIRLSLEGEANRTCRGLKVSKGQ
jgi:hypothetical protein